jgi:hypothetical protein
LFHRLLAHPFDQLRPVDHDANPAPDRFEKAQILRREKVGRCRDGHQDPPVLVLHLEHRAISETTPSPTLIPTSSSGSWSA